MMKMLKSDYWLLDVMTSSRMKVCFSEAVTLDEAVDLYNNDEIEDVIDDDIIKSKAVGTGKAIGDIID